MKPQRILGVDFGDRRTGLAATDYTGTIVVPLEPIVTSADAECIRRILAVADERETQRIVVGLPFNHAGEPTERTRRTMAFADALRSRTAIPVDTVDESHTTDEAHERLKAHGIKAARRKRVADSIAALIIVERYLAG